MRQKCARSYGYRTTSEGAASKLSIQNQNEKTHPSAANSIEFLVAFWCISTALDHILDLTRLLYSSRLGMGTTLTVWLNEMAFLFFLSPFEVLFFRFGLYNTSSSLLYFKASSNRLACSCRGWVHSCLIMCRALGGVAAWSVTADDSMPITLRNLVRTCSEETGLSFGDSGTSIVMMEWIRLCI